jgi:hypothetical protein
VTRTAADSKYSALRVTIPNSAITLFKHNGGLISKVRIVARLFRPTFPGLAGVDSCTMKPRLTPTPMPAACPRRRCRSGHIAISMSRSGLSQVAGQILWQLGRGPRGRPRHRDTLAGNPFHAAHKPPKMAKSQGPVGVSGHIETRAETLLTLARSSRDKMPIFDCHLNMVWMKAIVLRLTILVRAGLASCAN